MPVARLGGTGSDQAVPTCDHAGPPGGPDGVPHVSIRARRGTFGGPVEAGPRGSFERSLTARPQSESLGPRGVMRLSQNIANGIFNRSNLKTKPRVSQ